jgi:phosphoheptose isomerase/glycosyltransferase involved in cell wall biosynthesis
MNYNHIAIISEHASPLAAHGGIDAGGQNVYVEQVASSLICLGIKIDIYTRRESESIPEVVEHQGMRIINVWAGPATYLPKEQIPPYIEEFAQNICAFIQREAIEYDLVHANFWMSGLAAIYLKRKLNLPFAVTFHALGKIRRKFFGENDTWGMERLASEQAVIDAAAIIVATCPQEKEDLLSLYQISPNKIRIVPCGYDDFDFWSVNRTKARMTLSLQRNDFILLTVGRIVPRKGIDTIIQAVSLLKDRSINAKLIVIGGSSQTVDLDTDPEIGQLMKRAKTLGVEENVIFVGRKSRKELKYWYSSANIYVAMPHYEPFGITVLEAMACKTPVVASRVGGLQYTVDDKVTGELIEPNNPVELTSTLFNLYKNPSLLVAYGEKAKNKVRRFTWDKIAATLLLAYEEAAKSPCLENESHTISAAINGLEVAYHKMSERLPANLLTVVATLRDCFASGGKLLLAGNGGSAAQCQHLAAELVGRFQKVRPGLPALALTADGCLLTAWANDSGYEDIFSRQIQALAKPGDVFLAISTSGKSANLIRAVETCQQLKIQTIGILGNSGGKLIDNMDAAITIEGDNTPRIQEMQLLIVHLLVELLEQSPVTDDTNLSQRQLICHDDNNLLPMTIN